MVVSGEVLGDTDYILNDRHSAGPVGERWVVQPVSGGPARLADIVVPGSNQLLDSLCQNATKTKGWTEDIAVVNVLDTGWLPDETYYQVIDLGPEAIPLSQSQMAAQLSPAQLWIMASQLMAGLVHMHRRELVHCALSLDVIYQEGVSLRIGELWWAHTASRQAVNRSLSLQATAQWPDFTLPFMSPEMLRGEPPGRESDIFSFGALLFYLLTGQPPRMIKLPASRQEQIAELIESDVTPLEFLRSDVGEENAAIIHNMMGDDWKQRPSIVRLEPMLKYLASQPVLS